MADQNEIIAKKVKKYNSNRTSNILTWKTWAEKYALPPGSGDFKFTLKQLFLVLFTLIREIRKSTNLHFLRSYHADDYFLYADYHKILHFTFRFLGIIALFEIW